MPTVTLTSPAFPEERNALTVVLHPDGRLDLIRNGSLFPLSAKEKAALLSYLQKESP